MLSDIQLGIEDYIDQHNLQVTSVAGSVEEQAALDRSPTPFMKQALVVDLGPFYRIDALFLENGMGI